MKTRTPQGSAAWVVFLITLPLLAIPLYILFGRRKFDGYVRAKRIKDNDFQKKIINFGYQFNNRNMSVDPRLHILTNMIDPSFSSASHLKILPSGEDFFEDLFKRIEAAKHYILVQFYSVSNDKIGRRLRKALLKKQQQGVQVYFLYDQMGSWSLHESFIKIMKKSGILAEAFLSSKNPFRRMQINFRNHRKVVVIDGEIAYLGGINLGDEYLGRSEEHGNWRDTQLYIQGQAAQNVQLSFMEDWHWATQTVPGLHWSTATAEEKNKLLILPTSPADKMDTCALLFIQLINSARKRLWISSPYFVPDESILSALLLCRLRGVDIRILIPKKCDNKLAKLAGLSFLEDLEPHGIQFYRYCNGTLHQKAILVDDDLSLLGTANLDNRSMRLNFEISALAQESSMATELEKLFLQDFSHSEQITYEQLCKNYFWMPFAAKAARLLSPIL